MNLRKLLIQTVFLVVWIIFVFPILVGMAGYPFDIADPLMAGSAVLTGLIVSIITVKLTRKTEVVDQEPLSATEAAIVERVVTEKVVLVICPYCGTKNEQGITKCWKCHADI